MGNCFERNFSSSENNFFSFLTFAKLLKNKFLLEIGGSKQMASHGFSGNLGRKEKEKKKTIAWPGVKVPPETCALPGIASEKVAKILKERVQDTDDDLDDAKIPIEVNSGRLSSPLAAEAREKKGRGAGEGQVLLRHRGYILGPFEGCTGPVLCAQSQLLLSIRRGYIYIYMCTPLSFRPRVRGNPRSKRVLSFSPLLSLSVVQRMRKRSGGDTFVSLLGGCEWETRRTGSGYSRGCGPGAWVIVVESVTCWSGCIRCEPSWSDVVVKLKLLSEIVLFFLGSDYEFSPRSGSLFFYFFIFVVGRFWVRKIFVRWILEFINVDRIDRNYWKSVRYVLRWYMF